MLNPPLTPPDCNMEGFPRMMINIGRLRGSAFDATFNDGAWRAGVNLWMSAWQQVPAGSLENSEPGLTKAAGLGRDIRTWRKVRDEALHGWVLCDDGLYYHPVVAETVLDAWLTKLVQRLSSGYGNMKRYGSPFDPAAVTEDVRTAARMLERLDPKAEALSRPAVKKALAGIPPDIPTGGQEVPTGSQGKGRERTPKSPEGTSVELEEWKGPADVLRAIASAKGEVWALTYLRHCRHRDLPSRALVTSSSAIASKLRQEVEGELRALGVSVVIEAAA